MDNYMDNLKINELYHSFKKVGKNVLISDKAVFYAASNIEIGDNVRIDDFAILSAGRGGIKLGNYVHIACHTSIIGHGRIVMEDFSGISSRVAIYSSSDDYDGTWMTNPCLPFFVLKTKHEDVYIGKHVVVGTGSTILPGVMLSDGCAVGAMTLVNKSFLKNTIIVGIPGKEKGKRKTNIYELEKTVNNEPTRTTI